MYEDDSLNKIKSVYSQEQKLLLSFSKNNDNNKKYINFNKNNTNNKKKYITFNNTIINRPKSQKNNKYVIKEINLINKKKDYFNFDKTKTIEQELLWKKDYIFSTKNNLPNYIKKNKIFYLLRKLFIILPNDKKHMYTKNYPSDLFFSFYYPTRFINPNINNDTIRGPTKNDILCDDLNHILHEVYKYLKFSIYDSIKMEIYDENFRPIIKDFQLYVNKKRIIYVKITYLSGKEIISWKKRVESKLYPLDDNYLIKQGKLLKNNKISILYKDVSTEYNMNDNIITNYKDKSVIKNKLIKNNNKTENYLNANLETKYRTYSNESKTENCKLNLDYYNENYEQDIIDNLFVSVNVNNFLSFKNCRKTLSLLNTENKCTQDENNYLFNNLNKEKYINSNKNDFNSITKTKDNINNSPNKRNINLKTKINIKIKNNYLNNLNKKRRIGKIKNTLLSPLLFNFDVDDIINNKYILKYLANKNKEEIENNNINKYQKLKIKNLNDEDSNSYRNKKLLNINKIRNKNKSKNKNIKDNLNEKNYNNDNDNDNDNYNEENKDENEENINYKLEENREEYCNLNYKINEFITNEIDSLFTNKETDEFINLNCNYILINELKEFPISKIRKEFLFFSCLSNRIKIKYENLCSKINSILLDKNINIKDILLLNDFDKFLFYLEEVLEKIKNNKIYLFRYIGFSNKDVKMSFLLLILFIIYNKNLMDKKADIKLIYISLECIDIIAGSEITFQQYCDYRLLMTKNNNISFNKKFNFIKDLLLRVLINEKFNKTLLIERLKKIFDININEIKHIFSLDMCSVKLKQNNDIYNKVENLYQKFINYYSFECL